VLRTRPLLRQRATTVFRGTVTERPADEPALCGGALDGGRRITRWSSRLAVSDRVPRRHRTDGCAT